MGLVIHQGVLYMQDLDSFLKSQKPTALRPLLGLTVLLVEDSLTACEAIRLMCIRSGARIRRADCIESALRHLKIYRPSLILIDMGLPDGSGADLIAELAQTTPRVETILGISADPDTHNAAIAAGADGFIEKPLRSLAEFQAGVLKFLPEHFQPVGPRRVVEDQIEHDEIAMQEDLALAYDLLEDGDQTPETHRYLATFLSGVASTARDDELQALAQKFAKARRMGGSEQVQLSQNLSQRLAQKSAI